MSRCRGWVTYTPFLALGATAVIHAATTPGCAGGVNVCEGPDCPGNGGCTERGECSFERHCQLVACDDDRWVCAYDNESGVYRWLLEGQGAAKDCAYVAPPCKQDGGCADGACAGPCTDAPSNTCKDTSTLLTYSAVGTCVEGSCEYPSSEAPCPEGCADGKCIGDPCIGVSCNDPPACHTDPGTCADGECTYLLVAPGTTCAGGGTCNAAGVCEAPGEDKCQGVSCDRPHSTGGTCVDGACQGWTCTSGWGNCDDDWSDGCETALNTTTDCGSCGKRCSDGAHATATCGSGKCALSCTSPWADCDGNAGNGCEIPTGRANQCDRGGLNNGDGCGTAHCGPGNGSADQESFGSWHCTFCSHCHRWTDGYSWCLKDSGRFSPDRCPTCCGADEQDFVCSP